jgi:hypothetical protein
MFLGFIHDWVMGNGIGEGSRGCKKSLTQNIVQHISNSYKV